MTLTKIAQITKGQDGIVYYSDAEGQLYECSL